MLQKTSRKVCLCLIITVILSSLHLHAEYPKSDTESLCCADSIKTIRPSFQLKQLILPTTLIALGSYGVCNGTFRKLNNSVRDRITELRGNHYFRIDNYLQYLPIASYIGLGAVGVKCKHNIQERFVVGATAYLAMGLMVNTTKYAVREKRPDSNARNSFPSGHTATVFMGAELIRQEYGIEISIGAYAIATGVAFLRIYNDRHWLNDVTVGAGIGILSAKIGYWMLPLYQKWFHWHKTSSMIRCRIAIFKIAVLA